MGEAGAGGEAGEPAGGHSGTGGKGGAGGATAAGGEAGAPSEAGQGGAPVGAAGAPTGGAPDTSLGGAAGESSSAGAGGEGPLACVITGNVTSLSLPTQAIKTVCRGAVVTANWEASNTDTNFTCCGALGAASIAVPITGLGGSDAGQLAYTVPTDAPFGTQSMSVACSEGAVGSLLVSVSDEATLPQVTTTDLGRVDSQTQIEIDGAYLNGVTVTAVSTTDATSTAECIPNTDSSDSTRVVCSFGGDIAPGDYVLVIEQANCGASPVEPTLTVQSL